MPRRVQRAVADKEAMTLLEVLLALAIFALISNITLAIMGTTSIWIKHSRNESIATCYAASLLEELRGKPEMLAEASQMGPEVLGLGEGYTPIGPLEIKARVDMEKLEAADKLYRVKITLSWDEGEQNKDLSLLTLIRKGESRR